MDHWMEAKTCVCYWIGKRKGVGSMLFFCKRFCRQVVVGPTFTIFLCVTHHMDDDRVSGGWKQKMWSRGRGEDFCVVLQARGRGVASLGNRRCRVLHILCLKKSYDNSKILN
jgi:hypothetical protein